MVAVRYSPYAGRRRQSGLLSSPPRGHLDVCLVRLAHQVSGLVTPQGYPDGVIVGRRASRRPPGALGWDAPRAVRSCLTITEAGSHPDLDGEALHREAFSQKLPQPAGTALPMSVRGVTCPRTVTQVVLWVCLRLYQRTASSQRLMSPCFVVPVRPELVVRQTKQLVACCQRGRRHRGSARPMFRATRGNIL